MQADALLSGPGLAIAALVLAAAGVLVLDDRMKRSPRARTAARLAAMHARGQGAAENGADLAEADVFITRRRGLLGLVGGWLSDVSANIGGRRMLHVLFALACAAGFGLGLAGRAVAGLGLGQAAGLAVLGAFGAFYVAQAEMRRRWMIAFLDQLVDAVELLTRSVRAGYAVPAAIRMVGREVGSPVGDVFSQIANEDDLGIEMRDALRHAAHRVNLPDFTFLAIAMVIQRETGGQLGDSLDNLHFVLRKRREARLKLQALTAEGRMSAVIVGAIPFVAGGGVYLMNPEQTARLFEPGTGQSMMTVAGGLMLVGMLIIRWMVKARP